MLRVSGRQATGWEGGGDGPMYYWPVQVIHIVIHIGVQINTSEQINPDQITTEQTDTEKNTYKYPNKYATESKLILDHYINMYFI